MKKLAMLFAVMVLLVTACNQTTDTRSFIPGVYVNQSQGEYSIASDTLVVEAYESNNYFIHRKTGFRRITDGKPGKREYEIEEWNALYDQGTKSLTENRQGKLITFYPEANKLFVGKREYKKIN